MKSLLWWLTVERTPSAPLCDPPEGRDGVRLATVVVTTNDRPLLLREQLDAVVAQLPSVPFEVVVVDDGQGAATRGIVESYGDRHVPVRYVTSEGRGVSRARNVGASVAHGDAILFCDDDDLVCPGWVDALVDGLRGADLVAGALDFIELNSPTTMSWRGVDAADGTTHRGRPGPYAPGSNMGVRRVVLDAVGGFDESILYGGEDQDLSWRIQLAGFEYASAPDAVVRYRMRDDLWGAARQAYAIGRGGIVVDLRYGGAPVTARLFVARLWWLLRHVHWLLRGTERRGRWIVLAARTSGRVLAGVQRRVLYA